MHKVKAKADEHKLSGWHHYNFHRYRKAIKEYMKSVKGYRKASKYNSVYLIHLGEIHESIGDCWNSLGCSNRGSGKDKDKVMNYFQNAIDHYSQTVLFYSESSRNPAAKDMSLRVPGIKRKIADCEVQKNKTEKLKQIEDQRRHINPPFQTFHSDRLRTFLKKFSSDKGQNKQGIEIAPYLPMDLMPSHSPDATPEERLLEKNNSDSDFGREIVDGRQDVKHKRKEYGSDETSMDPNIHEPVTGIEIYEDYLTIGMENTMPQPDPLHYLNIVTKAASDVENLQPKESPQCQPPPKTPAHFHLSGDNMDTGVVEDIECDLIEMNPFSNEPVRERANGDSTFQSSNSNSRRDSKQFNNTNQYDLSSTHDPMMNGAGRLHRESMVQKQHPKFIEGMQYYRFKKYQEAFLNFQKALEDDPTDEETLRVMHECRTYLTQD